MKKNIKQLHHKAHLFYEKFYKKPLFMLLLCIAITGAGLLLYNTVFTVYQYIALSTNTYQNTSLHWTDFECVATEYVDENALITMTEDAQLLFSSPDSLHNLSIKFTSLFPLGECIAFYQEKSDAPFSLKKMLHARWDGNAYSFCFPPNVHSIRLDLGVNPSNTITFTEMRLNDTSPRFISTFSAAIFFLWFTLSIALYAVLFLCANTYALFFPNQITFAHSKASVE